VPVVRVRLPGVLAIEDDRREVRTAVFGQALASAFKLPDHVADRIVRRHISVQKADAVRDLAVAEDRGATARYSVRPVEELRLEQTTDVVALELDADRARQHALVRREPLEARLEDRARGFRRDRALRRPRTARLLAEGALVRCDRLLDLECRI